jgi:excinuclease UvrABC nuclease subunit
MEMPKWGEPFRLDILYDDWDEAPKKAGIYVVYTGETIQRAGGPDKKGILYIGKSLVLRNRLYNFWYVQHPASWLLWAYPKLTQLILNVNCKTKKQVEDLIGTFTAVVATPIPKNLLNHAEKSAMYAYFSHYGELPPLNFNFPMKWTHSPDKKLIHWAEKMLI